MKQRFTALLLTLGLLISAITVAAAADWGLSFPNPGQIPDANNPPEYYAAHNTYFVAPTTEKTIYLTFDAGYENGYTEPILDVLREKNVPAAFFLVGTYIRDYPELVRRMVDEGHTIGNHTMSHPDMTALTDRDAFLHELTQVEAHYEAAVGKPMPKLYRPPEGKYSEDNLKLANELGYQTFFWSLAYADWNRDAQPSKEAAFAKLLPRIHPGAILMLHSTSATNAAIMAELIDAYHDMGYTFKCITTFEQ